jgi:small GTP-binding protein
MNARLSQIMVLGDLTEQFGLSSLRPTIQACASLAQEGEIDIAVLGQFKSGKSSLLNTLLGQQLFPVGVLPVTAVITRVTAGRERQIRVTHIDGSAEFADPETLSTFVTETGNPHNQKQVSVVDAFIPINDRWSGLRLVDTPGLGSVYAHNTEATRVWMPSASVALVVVGAERPFSDADRQLVAEARQTAPRVVVVLNKVDLLSDAERTEVTKFIEQALRDVSVSEIPVLPFSSRVDADRWAVRLQDAVITPIAANVAAEREKALVLKLSTAVKTCQSYLTIALTAAKQTDAERERLRVAVFTETVGEALIRDELVSARQHVSKGTRAAFEKHFLEEQDEVEDRVRVTLVATLPTWEGNLAVQADLYRSWMNDRVLAELTSLSKSGITVGTELLGRAEVRFHRILTAFRSRLLENIQREMGISVSAVSWEPHRPELSAIPVAIGNPFMTNWELLWWLLPMRIVGGIFRRHILGLVHQEIEKNLFRLVNDWAAATDAAIANLQSQASSWVAEELTTLNRLIQQQPAAASKFRDALEQLTNMNLPKSANGL